MSGSVSDGGMRTTAKRVVRALVGAMLAAVTCALVSSTVAQARPAAQRATPTNAGGVQRQAGIRSAVSLRLSVGYGNMYRGGTWTPVHVLVRNDGHADVMGTVEIPQATSSATAAQPDFHGLYEATVLVPAGGRKDVTLYVPGSGVQGTVNARFLVGRTVLATASAAPIGFDTSALLIGVLAGGVSEMSWIAPAIQGDVTTHVIRLAPTTLDPVPEALAMFDMIVLTNVDTSQLDAAQLTALQRYVQNGGALLLVGGATWQETLRPLPATLLPGTITGTRVLSNLDGLSPLFTRRAPLRSRSSAAISVLSGAGGTVLAGQDGVPLVVRKIDGQGSIEYLAFDPSLSPVRAWAGASGLTEHLLAMAAPLAISRTWTPSAFRARFQRVFQAAALTGELSNLPSNTLPFLALFAALTLGYVFILGPLNFLLLRRIRRQSLAWVTIPALGLAYLVSIFGITAHARAATTVLNTVGLVTLGDGSAQPATLYMGLATPMSGDYHLTYRSAALPAPLPQLSHLGGFFSFRDASTLHATPLQMRLQEDPETKVTFLSMKRWSMRDMTLQTSLRIPGAVRSSLTLDPQGDLRGSIHNDTNLDLLDPVIVAGQSVMHLPAIPAGGTVRARISPSATGSGSQQTPLLVQAYGGNSSFPDDFAQFRDCCNGPSYPEERQLRDRVQNAASMIAQAQPDALSTLGEVMLLGWTDGPLGPVSVDGSAPERRDLTLVAMPLSVRFPASGAFRLRAGTFAGRLADILPRAPQSSCCGFGWGRDQQEEVTVGPRGFLAFEFDLPTTRHVRFSRLTLSVNYLDEGTGSGHAYDWHGHRWVKIDLSSGAASLPDPNRFVSPQGQTMVRLDGTTNGEDVTIADVYHDVQISGVGAAT